MKRNSLLAFSLEGLNLNLKANTTLKSVKNTKHIITRRFTKLANKLIRIKPTRTKLKTIAKLAVL
ncbi:MAG: hypothetical protein VX428_09895, partial [Verrucomicrobiota bacterium]|nr:hypothetical protein [Verrucomicrobiota bacterium]